MNKLSKTQEQLKDECSHFSERAISAFGNKRRSLMWHAAIQKWQYAEHVMRTTDDRPGKRGRGRPQHRWTDDIKRLARFN